MNIPVLNSIKIIEKQYDTGELPVLVTCSDKNMYICKYMRSATKAFKLASELIGAQLAKIWEIESPKYAFVNIKQAHWVNITTPHILSAPAFGYYKLDNIVDITPSTCKYINQTSNLLTQLLKIALFDFWIANEDRTYNNANLLYDMQNHALISIDYGGIFNTSTFEYPITQLMSTDTILYADIFQHLVKGKTADSVINMSLELKDDYERYIIKSQKDMDAISRSIPTEWDVPANLIKKKLQQLTDKEWTEQVWSNFIENINKNIGNE
ncbi:MAG: hypothetical protein J6K31_09520 [Parabacteroides sp.]|nr:hypothetical protein [Parabacteroides sp.]